MLGKLFLMPMEDNIKLMLRQGNFVVKDTLINLSTPHGTSVRCARWCHQ